MTTEQLFQLAILTLVVEIIGATAAVVSACKARSEASGARTEAKAANTQARAVNYELVRLRQILIKEDIRIILKGSDGSVTEASYRHGMSLTEGSQAVSRTPAEEIQI